MIELVVTRGVPLWQIGKLFSLIFPTFLEMTVPMAFLLAILLGLGRLSNDQELLAMKASGVSPGQILWPVVCLAILVSMTTLFLTLIGRPTANLALKKELYNIAKTRVATALKEKVFNDDFPKILIYVEEIVPPGNTAQGILIVDKRDKLREDIILGKVGIITTDEESNTLGLRLFDGSIYEREKNRPGFSQTRFNIYDFKLDLDDLVGPIREKEAGPKEMPLSDLLNAIDAKRRSSLTRHRRAYGIPSAHLLRLRAARLLHTGGISDAHAARRSGKPIVGIHAVHLLASNILHLALSRQSPRR